MQPEELEQKLRGGFFEKETRTSCMLAPATKCVSDVHFMIAKVSGCSVP